MLFFLLPQIGYTASSLPRLIRTHHAWGSGRHTRGVRPSIYIISIEFGGMAPIYSKKRSAYRLLRDWLVTYNTPFSGNKVFLWEWFFLCLDYETATLPTEAGATLWYLWYPKGNTLYLKFSIVLFTCLLHKIAGFFLLLLFFRVFLFFFSGRKWPIHFKAFF